MPSAADYLPPLRTLPALQTAAAGCRGCPLWQDATRTVFGEGPADARVMLVGEMPGNDEDLAGRPFVGPAGRMLDRALAEVGLDRATTYVTNVVKHFRNEPRGKRRLHKKPGDLHVDACMPWLDQELALVRPEVLVCLGATAAQALLGKAFRVTQERGRFVASPLAPFVLATIHPSAILRMPDEASRHEAYRAFVADLGPVAAKVRTAAGV